jgi:DNA-binding PucR family transcriptional regulator
MNISSAATAMDLNRHTVKKRLCGVEELLGCPLSNCATEIETVLRLWRLEVAQREPS